MSEIREALTLFNSMIRCGEDHTECSLAKLQKAIDEHVALVAEVARLKAENERLKEYEFMYNSLNK